MRLPKRSSWLVLINVAALAFVLACTPARQVARSEPGLPVYQPADPEPPSATDTTPPVSPWVEHETPAAEPAPVEPEPSPEMPAPAPVEAEPLVSRPAVAAPERDRDAYIADLTQPAPTARMAEAEAKESSQAHEHARMEQMLQQVMEQQARLLEMVEAQARFTSQPEARLAQQQPELSQTEHPTQAPLAPLYTHEEGQPPKMEVKVYVSPGQAIVIDERVLIQWEEAVAAMEMGFGADTPLPGWVLQGLEWITHAPTEEPGRSRTIMPLFRHMQVQGYFQDVNLQDMSPAEVVQKIRLFVDEMKISNGRIRKA
ncbi:MAG: hypothetical protein D6730_03995 [Bacteroidetes bacterium]|nr:MAG: hypothetical protein D6730_03995 [Bacteroidota bacterium]